jgi:hypothetical protein
VKTDDDHPRQHAGCGGGDADGHHDSRKSLDSIVGLAVSVW